MIAKVITTRLQKIMSHIISGKWAASIPGRKIVDNIILAHELVKSYNRKCIFIICMRKVELQKVYDFVGVSIFRASYGKTGFPKKFIRWKMNYVKIVNYSTLLNGESLEPFNTAKGLRQGDLTSPFLFAIAMEYLSRLLKGLNHEKRYMFYMRCGKLDITQIFLLMTCYFCQMDLISVRSYINALLHSNVPQGCKPT